MASGDPTALPDLDSLPLFGARERAHEDETLAAGAGDTAAGSGATSGGTGGGTEPVAAAPRRPASRNLAGPTRLEAAPVAERPRAAMAGPAEGRAAKDGSAGSQEAREKAVGGMEAGEMEARAEVHVGRTGDTGPAAPPEPPRPRALDASARERDVVPEVIPTASGQPAMLPDDREGIDWTLVHQVRLEIAEQIREQLAADQRLNRARHEPMARQITNDALVNLDSRRVQIGEPPFTPQMRAKITAAVLDATFGMGRLEPLLRLDAEDIAVRGHDEVYLYMADGSRVIGPPVAGSDEELIRDIQHMAATSPYGELSFSPANPILEMPLPDGSRLAATAWISPRPMITIRRHRLTDIALGDLVALGAMNPALQQFLTSCVRAGKNIVVSGLPSAGKTTLIRALLNELDPKVPVATIETDFELGIHNLPERHENVVALQAREGGEGGVGEVTLADLVRAALRHTVEVIVVGEVRSWEILDMLDAMRAGKGSVSTVHAKNPVETIDRLVECAMKAGPQVTPQSAYRQVASNLDVVISLGVLDQRPRGGRKHRFIQAIDAITMSDDARNNVAHTPIFTPGPDGRAVPTGNRPSWLADLEDHGFDHGWLAPENSHWDAPLGLLSERR